MTYARLVYHLGRVALVSLAAATCLSDAATVYAARIGGEQDAASVDVDLAKKLDEHLTRFAEYGFSGVVLVAKDGEGILSKGYGLADREVGRPVLPEQTVFTIGSITKQFTGAAVLRLEMDGKLSTNDPISKCFDQVPPDKAGITLHHLLTHTAGLRNVLGGDHDLRATKEWVLQEALASELQAPPGTRYSYSNLGYSLLGMIVEEVSGQEYEEYLHEHLFTPAGMTRTGYLLPGFDPGDLAIGYRDGEPRGTVLGRPMLTDGPCWNLRANGGIHSTVADLYKWHLALEGEEILSAEAKEAYFAPHAPRGGNRFYGYGWACNTTDRDTRLITHNGGNGVFFAEFHRFVDEDLAIIFATNTADFPGEEASDQLTRVIFGQPSTLPPKVAQLNKPSLERCAGIYELADGGVVSVSVEGDYLALRSRGRGGFAALSLDQPVLPADTEKLYARTEEMLEACASGDRGPLTEAFDAEHLAKEIDSAYGEIWDGFQSQFGALRSVEVLGSLAEGSLVTTYVRADFERGHVFRQYEWERSSESSSTMRLVGTGGWGGPPTLRFFPWSESEFMTFGFELGPADLMRAEFEADETGVFTGLTLTKHDHSVYASRAH